MSDRYYEQAVYKACRLCNLPRNKRLDIAERFELAEWVLDWYGFGGSTFGVEYAGLDNAGSDAPSMAHLNAGETYALTICVEWNYFDCEYSGDFFASSWGDWYEAAEAEKCSDDGVTRCGYCGEFTPLSDDVDWSDTRCESCGRNVSTGEVMEAAAADDDEDDE